MSNEKMEYRSLGRCGTRVSAFSLGGWTTYGELVTDEKRTSQIILAAYEAGVNFFDIADIYASGEAERFMGKVLCQLPRHTLVISSKVYWPLSDDVNDRGLSRKHIMESIDKSLKRIGTDYLDIYFCHRFDDATPLEETLRAMDDLIHRGKILHWGTSEWTGAQLGEVHRMASRDGLYPPRVEQPQLSLLARQKFETDVAPAAQRLGMGMVVWSPLASGVLTGKYDSGIPAGTRLEQMTRLQEIYRTERNLARLADFKKLADELGFSRAQLALAWAAATPGVSSVITGATQLSQLKENLGATDVEITDEIRTRLDAIFPPTGPIPLP